jgi:predicted RNA binding protein YcfA (HicA-like mRNA interferase family)
MIKRRVVVRWLLRNGFERADAAATGHIHYVNSTGVKVTLRGHGPEDLDGQAQGWLVRQLMKAGFNKDVIKRELFGHRKTGTHRTP